MTVVPTLAVEGYVGTLWKPIITVHDEAGDPTDPEAIIVTLRNPDGEEAPVEAPKVGDGEYQPQVQITTPGPWVLIPQSTNPTAPGKLIFNAVHP